MSARKTLLPDVGVTEHYRVDINGTLFERFHGFWAPPEFEFWRELDHIDVMEKEPFMEHHTEISTLYDVWHDHLYRLTGE
jgi:hypothetical protein